MMKVADAVQFIEAEKRKIEDMERVRGKERKMVMMMMISTALIIGLVMGAMLCQGLLGDSTESAHYNPISAWRALRAVSSNPLLAVFSPETVNLSGAAATALGTGACAAIGTMMKLACAGKLAPLTAAVNVFRQPAIGAEGSGGTVATGPPNLCTANPRAMNQVFLPPLGLQNIRGWDQQRQEPQVTNVQCFMNHRGEQVMLLPSARTPRVRGSAFRARAEPCDDGHFTDYTPEMMMPFRRPTYPIYQTGALPPMSVDNPACRIALPPLPTEALAPERVVRRLF